MVAVLGGLVDVERDLIRTRTGEGRARAKLRGQHMGRPSKMTAALKQEARRRGKDGEFVADLARSYGVTLLRSTEQRPEVEVGRRKSDGAIVIRCMSLCFE